MLSFRKRFLPVQPTHATALTPANSIIFLPVFKSQLKTGLRIPGGPDTEAREQEALE